MPRPARARLSFQLISSWAFYYTTTLYTATASDTVRRHGHDHDETLKSSFLRQGWEGDRFCCHLPGQARVATCTRNDAIRSHLADALLDRRRDDIYVLCRVEISALRMISATPVPDHTNGTCGPEIGHLVIVGGNLQSDSIWEKIIELSGGPNASIVVIPTAGGEPSYNDSFASAVTLRELGANNVTVLHTYDPALADTDDFVAPLLEAGGIFFGGGRQWRLVDAYAGTKAESAFQSVLDRGGVIAGSSAGASIQGSFLARGDTNNNQVMIGDHTVGFGYLKNAAIDQHVLIRNRHFDLFDILKVHPHLLGIGIDEDTALIVHKNEAQVFGRTYALIYDSGFYSEEGTELKNLPPPEARFYFLKPDERYDLKARKVIDADATATTAGKRSEL